MFVFFVFKKNPKICSSFLQTQKFFLRKFESCWTPPLDSLAMNNLLLFLVLFFCAMVHNASADSCNFPVPIDLASNDTRLVMDTTWQKGSAITGGELLAEWVVGWSQQMLTGYLTVLYYQNGQNCPTAIQRYVYGVYWDTVHYFGGVDAQYVLGAHDPNYCPWSDNSHIVGEFNSAAYHFQLQAQYACNYAWDHRWKVYQNAILSE